MASKMEDKYKWKYCVIWKKCLIPIFFLKLSVMKLESNLKHLASIQIKNKNKNADKMADQMAVYSQKI